MAKQREYDNIDRLASFFDPMINDLSSIKSSMENIEDIIDKYSLGKGKYKNSTNKNLQEIEEMNIRTNMLGINVYTPTATINFKEKTSLKGYNQQNDYNYARNGTTFNGNRPRIVQAGLFSPREVEGASKEIPGLLKDIEKWFYKSPEAHKAADDALQGFKEAMKSGSKEGFAEWENKLKKGGFGENLKKSGEENLSRLKKSLFPNEMGNLSSGITRSGSKIGKLLEAGGLGLGAYEFIPGVKQAVNAIDKVGQHTVDLFSELDKQSAMMAGDLGNSKEEMMNMLAIAQKLNAQQDSWRVDIDDTRKSMEEMAKQFGYIDDSMVEEARQQAAMSQLIGVGNDQQAEFNRTLQTIGKSIEVGEDGFNDITRSIIKSSQISSVSWKPVMRDIENNAELIAHFGKDQLDNITQTAIQARKMGVSLDTFVKTANSFDDFEGALQNTYKLNSVLGSTIDPMRMFLDAQMGDFKDMQSQIIDSLTQQEKLNPIQIKYATQILGLSSEEVRKLVEQKKLQNDINNFGEIQSNTIDDIVKNLQNSNDEKVKGITWDKKRNDLAEEFKNYTGEQFEQQKDNLNGIKDANQYFQKVINDPKFKEQFSQHVEAEIKTSDSMKAAQENQLTVSQKIENFGKNLIDQFMPTLKELITTLQKSSNTVLKMDKIPQTIDDTFKAFQDMSKGILDDIDGVISKFESTTAPQAQTKDIAFSPGQTKYIIDTSGKKWIPDANDSIIASTNFDFDKSGISTGTPLAKGALSIPNKLTEDGSVGDFGKILKNLPDEGLLTSNKTLDMAFKKDMAKYIQGSDNQFYELLNNEGAIVTSDAKFDNKLESVLGKFLSPGSIHQLIEQQQKTMKSVNGEPFNNNLSKLVQLISENEGSYGSFNPDNEGAPTYGEIQWRGKSKIGTLLKSYLKEGGSFGNFDRDIKNWNENSDSLIHNNEFQKALRRAGSDQKMRDMQDRMAQQYIGSVTDTMNEHQLQSLASAFLMSDAMVLFGHNGFKKFLPRDADANDNKFIQEFLENEKNNLSDKRYRHNKDTIASLGFAKGTVPDGNLNGYIETDEPTPIVTSEYGQKERVSIKNESQALKSDEQLEKVYNAIMELVNILKRSETTQRTLQITSPFGENFGVGMIKSALHSQI